MAAEVEGERPALATVSWCWGQQGCEGPPRGPLHAISPGRTQGSGRVPLLQHLPPRREQTAARTAFLGRVLPTRAKAECTVGRFDVCGAVSLIVTSATPGVPRAPLAHVGAWGAPPLHPQLSGPPSRPSQQVPEGPRRIRNYQIVFKAQKTSREVTGPL